MPDCFINQRNPLDLKYGFKISTVGLRNGINWNVDFGLLISSIC